jgi:hypothetical protein
MLLEEDDIGTIDDRFDGFVTELTKCGTKHGYAVRDGFIYEIIDGKAVRVYGRVVNDIAYRYNQKGRLDEIGRLDKRGFFLNKQ